MFSNLNKINDEKNINQKSPYNTNKISTHAQKNKNYFELIYINK